MRIDATPSQPSGHRLPTGARACVLASSNDPNNPSAVNGQGTMRFVPSVIVIGR